MAEGPALWRSAAAMAACLAAGFAAGPFVVRLALKAEPFLGGVLQKIGVREAAVGVVVGLVAIALGLAIGALVKAGRFLAGWLLGFALTETYWRPAIVALVDGAPKAFDRVVVALVTAAGVALLAAMALDAGRRLRMTKRG